MLRPKTKITITSPDGKVQVLECDICTVNLLTDMGISYAGQTAIVGSASIETLKQLRDNEIEEVIPALTNAIKDKEEKMSEQSKKSIDDILKDLFNLGKENA